MNYQVIRSRRTTIALQVTREAELVIRAPFFASDKVIERLVRTRRAWIEKTQARMMEVLTKHPVRQFCTGENLTYLGKTYPLEVIETPCVMPQLEGDRFILSREYVSHARKLFERWYREQAESYLPGRVTRYAEKVNVCFQSIKINGAKARWGSCSADGRLNFSWRLMMAPPEVVDYVAAHEVAHLVEQNHSRRFWAVVAGLDPGYLISRAWLRKHESGMSLD